VLLIVLWWLVLLAFLATQLAATTRTAAMIASNLRDSASAEAAADGAVNEAIFQFLAHRWQADGTSHFISGTREVVEVRIEDEGDRIDPNVAPRALMQALLGACGASPETAIELAAAIADWRSPDIFRSARTEKAAQYRIAQYNYLPPGTRFVSVDELGLVMGMTPELLACLKPHVSVYSLSVPTLQSTTDYLVRRAVREAYPDDATHPVVAIINEVAVVRITAIAQGASGSRFQRIGVVRIPSVVRDDHFAFKILAWE
jgi:general secretion pathway protein K